LLDFPLPENGRGLMAPDVFAFFFSRDLLERLVLRVPALRSAVTLPTGSEIFPLGAS